MCQDFSDILYSLMFKLFDNCVYFCNYRLDNIGEQPCINEFHG